MVEYYTIERKYVPEPVILSLEKVLEQLAPKHPNLEVTKVVYMNDGGNNYQTIAYCSFGTLQEKNKCEIEVEIKNLPVADFLINNIAIERKTVSDFISSMLNRRLLTQLEEINQYEKKLLIIEGIDDKTINIKELAKKLKSKLACGGTVKNRIIELQGEHTKKIKPILVKLGFDEESIE